MTPRDELARLVEAMRAPDAEIDPSAPAQIVHIVTTQPRLLNPTLWAMYHLLGLEAAAHGPQPSCARCTIFQSLIARCEHMILERLAPRRPTAPTVRLQRPR